jgi:hypothetical protein
LARAIIGKWKLLPDDPVAATLTHKGHPFVFADVRNSQLLRRTVQPPRVRKHGCLIPGLRGDDRIGVSRSTANAPRALSTR